MPIYEYQCSACGHEMEALQKMSDPHLTDCPACSASALRKKVTAAAFRLSGSGWYETDFKQDNKKNLTDSGSENKDSKSDKPSDKKENSGKADKTATPAKGTAPDSSKSKSPGKSADK